MITEADRVALAEWAARVDCEVDWSQCALPPCSRKVAELCTSERRRAALAQTYYEPSVTRPEPSHADRVIRSTDDLSVVVGVDGAVLAAWSRPPRVDMPRQRPAPSPQRRRSGPSGLRGPRDHGDLLAMIEAEGATLVASRRHLRVACPTGAQVFICKTPSDARSVRNDAALLRRIGGLELRRTA